MLRNLLRRICLLFKRRPTLTIQRTTGDLEDLMGNVWYIDAMIDNATRFKTLEYATQLTNLLYSAFPDLYRTAYWMNRLHNRILLRRCELIAQQPMTEA